MNAIDSERDGMENKRERERENEKKHYLATCSILSLVLLVFLSLVCLSFLLCMYRAFLLFSFSLPINRPALAGVIRCDLACSLSF